MVKSNIVDKIIAHLADCKEHEVEEIRKIFNNDKLLKLIELLKEIGFVKIEKDKISITEMGLRYMELPEE